MVRTIATILFVVGLALIVSGISIKAFPSWLSLPGGIILLLAAAFLGVAELGGKLKDWREFLFGNEDKKNGSKKQPAREDEQAGSHVPPSVEIRKNLLVGKNKLGTYQDHVNISENKLIGENEIEVGEKTKSGQQVDPKSVGKKH